MTTASSKSEIDVLWLMIRQFPAVFGDTCFSIIMFIQDGDAIDTTCDRPKTCVTTGTCNFRRACSQLPLDQSRRTKSNDLGEGNFGLALCSIPLFRLRAKANNSLNSTCVCL